MILFHIYFIFVLICSYYIFSTASFCSQIKPITWSRFISLNVTCSGSETTYSLTSCTRLCSSEQDCLGFVFKESSMDNNNFQCLLCDENKTGVIPSMRWKTDHQFYITNKNITLYSQVFNNYYPDKLFNSCQEIKENLNAESGVYQIAKASGLVSVYCNMTLTKVWSKCYVNVENMAVKFHSFCSGKLYVIVYKPFYFACLSLLHFANSELNVGKVK
mgnify:CR=1 FL=1